MHPVYTDFLWPEKRSDTLECNARLCASPPYPRVDSGDLLAEALPYCGYLSNGRESLEASLMDTRNYAREGILPLNVIRIQRKEILGQSVA